MMPVIKSVLHAKTDSLEIKNICSASRSNGARSWMARILEKSLKINCNSGYEYFPIEPTHCEHQRNRNFCLKHDKIAEIDSNVSFL